MFTKPTDRVSQHNVPYTHANYHTPSTATKDGQGLTTRISQYNRVSHVSSANMAPYIDTPRTDARDRTIANMDFSEMPSFHAPAGADDLLNAMKTAPNATRKTHTFATPSARTGGRRAPVTKPEFTPLLHSAVRNRQSRQMLGGELETPAALKAGYRFSSPALPEASMMGGDSMVSDTDETPIPIPNSSSSAMGTPLPQMPRKGDLGLNGDGGNVLTLKEQEEVCQIAILYEIAGMTD